MWWEHPPPPSNHGGRQESRHAVGLVMSANKKNITNCLRQEQISWVDRNKERVKQTDINKTDVEKKDKELMNKKSQRKEIF